MRSLDLSRVKPKNCVLFSYPSKPQLILSLAVTLHCTHKITGLGLVWRFVYAYYFALHLFLLSTATSLESGHCVNTVNFRLDWSNIELLEMVNSFSGFFPLSIHIHIMTRHLYSQYWLFSRSAWETKVWQYFCCWRQYFNRIIEFFKSD